MPDNGPPPSPHELQFQHAEPIADATSSEGSAPACVVCKQPVGGSYYQAQGQQVVCPLCAERIRAGQQAAPPISLLRAALYGGGAALAGCALYAAVAIKFNEIALIAVLVGWMVGKAVRHGSYGRGGRPQQILAVLLTYFAITTSYIPVILYHAARSPRRAEQRQQAQITDAPAKAQPLVSFGTTALFLLVLTAVAPFLALTSGMSAWVSLFILVIGLQRAWQLTARREIVLMGPYQAEVPQ
jgi:hypothetical protein